MIKLIQGHGGDYMSPSSWYCWNYLELLHL